MSNLIYLNLACGNIYLKKKNWINFDFYSRDKFVKSIDLLKKFPLNDNSVDAIYCSHFIEHIPLSRINFFLNECYRVLKFKGFIRIVTPDFVEMCISYLKFLRKDPDKSTFLITEIIDQLVRKKNGGNLAELYRKYLKDNNIKMINFVYERVGKKLINKKQFIKKNIFFKIKNKLLKIYLYYLSFLYPTAFRNQNISFADIGENHHWLWDFYQLHDKLKKNKFSFIKKMNYRKTNIKNFPIKHLEMNNDYSPRKGKESLYIEARKII